MKSCNNFVSADYSRKNSGSMKKHIFLVDDDEDEMLFLNDALTTVRIPIKCTWAKSGEQALMQLEYLMPDIIFLDYNMPSSNGLEILRQIKTTKPNIYILLISGQKDIQIALSALKDGAADYIIKGEEDLDMISNVINKIMTTRVPISKLYELN